MPMYTYRRTDGTTFEYRQKFTDAPLTIDPATGEKVTRVVHAAGVIFKGSGFYVTDTKGAGKSAAPGTASDTKTEVKSSTPTETKAASAEAAAD